VHPPAEPAGKIDFPFFSTGSQKLEMRFHIGTAQRFRGGVIASFERRRQQEQRPVRRRLRFTDCEPCTDSLPPIHFKNPPKWLILPDTLVPPAVARAFEFIPYGFEYAQKALQESGSSPFLKAKFKPPKGLRLKPFPFFTKGFSNDMQNAIYTNQRIRWRFKRLLQRWRLSRFRQANTIDVVTMEEPKQPVYVYDWPTRTKYVFEATTLFRGIRTSLLLADELFPMPKEPKNPYTNQPFSYGQLHFTLNALRERGRADWATEAFRTAGYDLTVFKRRNNMQLRLAALNSLFAKPTDIAYVDTLFDFIDFSHDNAEIEMARKDVWLWAIENSHDHAHIQCWRVLCYDFYKGSITMSPDDYDKLKEKIQEEADKLILMPIVELVLLWRASRPVA
jgi:hypothetical protein